MASPHTLERFHDQGGSNEPDLLHARVRPRGFARARGARAILLRRQSFATRLSKLRITTYSGNNQTERVGSTLAEPLVVKVTDILGQSRSPAIAVSFSTHASRSRP